jgi:type II secretory pathway component PulL
MEGLIGTPLARLQRNSRELARIMRPDNQRTHNPDGSLNQVAAQSAWQEVQTRMQSRRT